MREDIRQRIGEILEEAIARKETAGALVLFLRDGEEEFFEAHGYANLEKGSRLERSNIFRLFSMTKPITSAAAMILMDEGRLDLGQPVSEVLPGFKGDRVIEDGRERPCQVPMTINNLLNMTSGITYGGTENENESMTLRFLEDCETKLMAGKGLSTREFAVRLSEIPLAFEPGSSWQYGLSADVLGAVIEEVSGMRFGDFLQEKLFGPLKMVDTGFFVPKEKQNRLADCYRSMQDGSIIPFTGDQLLVRYRMDERPALESGGAGLVSTIDDYARFARMLLNGGELEGVRILSPRTVEFMTSGNLTPAQQEKLTLRFNLCGFTYQHLLRQMRDHGSYTTLTRGSEYGWDSWTGCYFANIPEEKRCMLLMEQKAETGTTSFARKIRNVWLKE